RELQETEAPVPARIHSAGCVGFQVSKRYLCVRDHRAGWVLNGPDNRARRYLTVRHRSDQEIHDQQRQVPPHMCSPPHEIVEKRASPINGPHSGAAELSSLAGCLAYHNYLVSIAVKLTQ